MIRLLFILFLLLATPAFAQQADELLTSQESIIHLVRERNHLESDLIMERVRAKKLEAQVNQLSKEIEELKKQIPQQKKEEEKK